VRDAVALLSVQAESKSIALTQQVSAEVPQTVITDATRLRQILVNLVGNAVKFTDDGSVRVDVDVEARKATSCTLRFRVTDTGIGISDEISAKLFTPFMQADSFHTRRFGGTGLGLAISAQLASLLGGDIRVFSRPGQGSVFECTIEAALPLAGGEDAPNRGAAVEKPDLGSSTFRVLVAEDSKINERLFVSMLKTCGISADVAHDGLQVVERALEGEYDLIFMDVHMPGIDGLEATRRIRSSDRLTRQPVIIALTASAIAGDRERCMEAGMNDFLSKPVHLHTFRATLGQWMKHPSSSEATVPSDAGDLLDRAVIDEIRGLGDDGGALYTELFVMFVEQFPKMLRDIQSGIDRDDAPLVERLSHTIAGSSGGIGLMAVQRQARVLEDRAHDGSVSMLGPQMNILRETVERSVEALACGGITA
jgi:CheY-like chemotaxis protein/HPt (histidine-containing phosphotransfer) domain-containing protein